MTNENQQSFANFEKLYWRLSRDMGYLWKEIFETHFPGSQSHILFALERKGPRKMSELAEVLHLTPGAVTSATDKLLKNEYIARIRDDKDRRVVHIKITEKGRASITKLQGEGRKVMKKVFNHVSENDLTFLVETFEQAAKNIQAMGKDNDK